MNREKITITNNSVIIAPHEVRMTVAEIADYSECSTKHQRVLFGQSKNRALPMGGIVNGLKVYLEIGL